MILTVDNFHIFRARFIFNSNKVEGSDLTLEEVTAILKKNKPLDLKKDSTSVLGVKKMIPVSNIMEDIILNKKEVTITEIININRSLEFDKSKLIRSFRQMDNINTPFKVKPCQVDMIEKEFELLIFHYKMCNRDGLDKEDEIKNILRFVVGYHSIVPFEGNNRKTVRAVMSIMFASKNIKPSAIESISSEEVIDILEKCIEEYRTCWADEFWFEKLFNLVIQAMDLTL